MSSSQKRAAVRRSKARGQRKPANARAMKISVTVEERVLAQAKREARRRGRTLSAHVNEALARDFRRRRLEALIEQYEAEHGALTEGELVRIRKQWQA